MDGGSFQRIDEVMPGAAGLHPIIHILMLDRCCGDMTSWMDLGEVIVRRLRLA